ncbi:MAG: peptidyl-prolyl cis-trans isomerase [Proteobacteria bacterium]|nr:peptidyl-prolyl cis-trans isomerase [Pseudomonadota bacterium]
MNVLLALAALTAFSGAHAQSQPSPVGATPAAPAEAPTPPDTELLHNGKARVLQADYDAELERVPANIRAGFGTDVDRINALLQQILVDKTLAADARAQGLDKDPDVQRRIQLTVDKLLTSIVIERDRAAWGREFDARPGNDVAAREQWLTQPDKYSEPPRYRLTTITFAIPPNTAAEALERAEAARASLASGTDTKALAASLASTPGATVESASEATPLDKQDTQVRRALERLTAAGDISRPIRQPTSVRLVRIDERVPGAPIPFDKAKDGILKQMRDAYIDAKLAEMLNGIRKDPSVVVNQPAVDKLLVRVSPDDIKRAMKEALQSREQGARRAGSQAAPPQ